MASRPMDEPCIDHVITFRKIILELERPFLPLHPVHIFQRPEAETKWQSCKLLKLQFLPAKKPGTPGVKPAGNRIES